MRKRFVLGNPFPPFAVFKQDDDDDANGGGGGGGGGRGSDPDVIVSRFGADVRGMAAHISTLEKEAYRNREKLRQMTTERDEALAKVPGDSHVVLPKDDAEALAKYRELGPLDDITKRLGEYGTLTERVNKADRENLLRAVADSANMNVDVLTGLDGQLQDTQYVKKSVPQPDGSSLDVWYVQHKNDTGAVVETSVTEFYDGRFAAYKPALYKGEPGGQGSQTFPAQQAGGNAPAQSLAASTIMARYGHATGKTP